MKYWGKLDTFWGGVWGLLFGVAFYAAAGFGLLQVVGLLMSWMVGVLRKRWLAGFLERPGKVR